MVVFLQNLQACSFMHDQSYDEAVAAFFLSSTHLIVTVCDGDNNCLLKVAPPMARKSAIERHKIIIDILLCMMKNCDVNASH